MISSMNSYQGTEDDRLYSIRRKSGGLDGLVSACCPTSILTKPVDSGQLGTDPNPSAILISRLAELVRRDVITLTRTLTCTASLRPG